jgi:hypothetical protein
MAKISIAVNARDLREIFQKSIGLVPCARVPGLLRALEKIAVKRSDADPFEVGVTSLRILGGRFAIEPRGEDLLKESVVTSLLCGADKKVLIQLHSQLFEQLWTADSETVKEVSTGSAEGEQKGPEGGYKESAEAQNGVAEPVTVVAPAGGNQAEKPIEEVPTGSVEGEQKGPEGGCKESAEAQDGVAEPVTAIAAASGNQVNKPIARGRKPAQNNGDEEGAAAARNNEKGIIFVDEKKIFVSIRSALDNLDFADLLAVNVAAAEAVGSLKKGVSLSAPRCKVKRLSGCGDKLTLELESEDETTASLVRGVLGGLSFPSLMQLGGELLSRINRSQAAPKLRANKAV